MESIGKVDLYAFYLEPNSSIESNRSGANPHSGSELLVKLIFNSSAIRKREINVLLQVTYQ